MLTPRQAALFFLLPAVLAGLALMLGARTRPDETGRRRPGTGWIGALGMGIGFLAGYVALLGWPRGFPPHDANAALFYVVAGAAVLAGCDSRSPLPALLARLIVCVGAPTLYLKNLVRNWENDELLHQLGPIALAALVLWTGMQAFARVRPGASAPLALWLAATGLSVGLLWTGFAINAQLAGTLASLMGAATVASWIWKRASLAGGAAGVASVILVTLAAGGVQLSKLPDWSALAFALAPLAVWLVPRNDAAAKRTLFLRLCLVAIPVGLGLWIAWEHRPPPDPYADYY